MVKMNKKIIVVFILLISSVQFGCSSMFAHLFGSDHLKDKKYKFLLFDDLNSKIMYGGYMEINNTDEKKFSGSFRIIDVFAESIPVGSGKVEGTQNEDKDRAEMSFQSKLSEDKIIINLDRTWNLLEGNWKYKSAGGKFIAFEN